MPMQMQMAGESSMSSSFSYGWSYDVFLSFRGKDTRHGFTGNLFNAFRERGIHTFFDDQELHGGEEITPTLVKAIEESRIAIPVFSINYASSSFCLDELVSIIECVKAKGRLVLPVFYGVDPSHVRHQTDNYGEAMAKHEERFKDDKDRVQNWREALEQAANLSGKHFVFGNEYEHEFIKKIIEVVSIKINRVPLHVTDYPVGLESPMLELCSLLDVGLGSDDGAHMVGIHGVGGMGKTTLARAVYNSIADQFEGLCFLENVRENSMKHGLEHLQQKLVSEIVGERDVKLGSVNRGIQIIKQRLCRKKVLLILDDVDKRQQLRALAGGPHWFGSGSRVIITTRDKHLLAYHGVERTYELNGLNEEDARQLFVWNAFKNKQVDPSFVSIINRAMTYAAQLPLALEVIGSNLCGKEIQEWESALDRYERIPEKEIQEILKISFDGLEEDAQSVFLDIACCFKGIHLKEIKDILSAHHGFCPKHAIGVLVDKSLIKINEFGEVILHDLIQNMGREIVRKEGKPGKRSRLWFSEDIIQVLEDNEGTCKIEMIFMDLHKVVEWDGEAFKDMKSLKTLIIRNTYFSQAPKHLPNSLRVLEWWSYPSHSLPDDFRPTKLVMLKLPFSCSTSLNLFKVQKELVNMSVLIFDGAKRLTNIPDLSCVPRLEKLSFRDCENLVEVDESVGFLGKLRMLDGYYCKKLRSIPPLMLPSLENLELNYCSNLESFPEILGKMENITHLSLQGTAIKELSSSSVENLTQLDTVFMEHGMINFRRSEHVFSSWNDASHDQAFANGSIKAFTWYADKVEALHLRAFSFEVLPATIIESLILKKLELVNCYNVGEIRELPPNLEELSVTYCKSLQDLDLTGAYLFLRRLVLEDCENLREIRGISSNLELVSLFNCTSLTYSSRSMLVNQELHEEGGNMRLFMPAPAGSGIPEWFQHRNNGPTISLWFGIGSMFPPISVCVTFGGLNGYEFDIFPILYINGNAVKKWVVPRDDSLTISAIYDDHICIFDEKQWEFEDNNVNEYLLQENEWNHVKIRIYTYSDFDPAPFVKQVGIHVFKEKSNMEDIRFIDPCENERGHNNANWDSSTSTSSASNVKGLQEQQQHLTSTVVSNNERAAKWQFCLCSLFSSLVSLCSSSSSLDSH